MISHSPLPPAYWILVAARRFVVGLPCLYLFIESQGLSSFANGLCLTALAGAQLLCEVPSGVASDRLGRKRTLMMAATARLVAWVLLGFSSSVWGCLPGFFLLGVAVAFESGTDSAFLFDTLRQRDLSHQYASLEARSYQVSLLSAGVATLLGGGLMMFGFRLPILATIIPMAVYLLATTQLVEPTFVQAKSRDDFSSQLRIGLQQVLTNSRLFLSTTAAVSVIAVCEIYFRFIQQHLNGPVGIAPRFFGWIYFFWLLLSVVSSRIGQKSSLQNNPLRVILISALSCGISLVLIGNNSVPLWLVLLLSVFPQAAYGIVPTVLRSEINRDVPSAVRATILSVFGFGTSSLIASGALVCGWLAVTYSVGTALSGVGSILVITTLLGWWLARHADDE